MLLEILESSRFNDCCCFIPALGVGGASLSRLRALEAAVGEEGRFSKFLKKTPHLLL